MKNALKVTLRILGGLIGITCIAFALFPIDMMTTQSIVVFILIGIIFLFYGLTGKSSF